MTCCRGTARKREFTERVRRELLELHNNSRVRGVAISCHDRKLTGELTAQGALDALMIRYNAGHRGPKKISSPGCRLTIQVW